ncbi:MAG: hypothetical protein AAGG02_01925 [Cyanobacteria bacterium P01_H01_bin.15]
MNSAIATAIKELNFRGTVGDVSAQAGLNLEQTQQALNALAADANGTLKVSESGDIIYEFPRNFVGVLRSKNRRLQWLAFWERVRGVLFYGVRLSFGILLLLSILLMLLAIVAIIIAATSQRSDSDRDNRSSGFGGGGMFFVPRFWIGPNWFWYFNPRYNYYAYQDNPQQSRRVNRSGDESGMNFLEAVFSFIFGDGNPNYNLESIRWQSIGSIIRQEQGVVTAEQVAPYLDDVDEDEDFMLPVLVRFNGAPEVSPQGELVYTFPELQVTAQSKDRGVSAYLREKQRVFSEASQGQLTMAGGLGVLNLVLAIVLGVLLTGETAQSLGGLVAFVGGIYGLLIIYAIAFLAIPAIRYFWLQGQNQGIAGRNDARRDRAETLLNPVATVKQKLAFAKQFAQRKLLKEQDISYSSDQSLAAQETGDQADKEWQQRLERGF